MKKSNLRWRIADTWTDNSDKYVTRFLITSIFSGIFFTVKAGPFFGIVFTLVLSLIIVAISLIHDLIVK